MSNVPDNSGTGVTAEVVSAPSSAAAPGPSDAAPTSTDAPPSSSSAAPAASGTPESNSTLVATPPDGSATGASAIRGGTAPAAGGANLYGLTQPLGASTPAPLPPIDKPAAAPDQINDVKSNGPAQVTTGTTSGKAGKKNPKPAFNSSEESSSKHKKKKGVDKLNPF